jgi:Cys-rich repeat protein
MGAVGVAAALAACGRLDTPDLSTGAVSGRLTGAPSASAGHAYVLNWPECRAALAADGTFTLDRVPVGAQQVVLFDGASRAEILSVVVRPGSRTPLDRAAVDMPLAGRISAAVRPTSGAVGTGASFTVVGTIHQALAAIGEGRVINPLPPGTFQVSATLAGFRPLPVTVTVAAGLASAAEVTMDVEESDGDHKGCLATSCPNGLHCDPADGKCRACVADGDCGAGNVCDPGTHTCVEGTYGGGTFCESATAASYCSSGILVPMSGGLGYCSASCAVAADCPAGWDCQGSVCVVKATCFDVAATFGSACAHDDPCREGLFGGTCLQDEEDEPGYCTVPCASTADGSCAAAGFGTCKLGPRGGTYCQP